MTHSSPVFGPDGRVPAVCQDASTGELLMVAWMDAEAWRLTRETGFAHFYSRSRQRIWKKGETSGHTLRVREVRLDCDHDTILLRVDPGGPACHTGARSCFFEVVEEEPPGARADDGWAALGRMLARLAATIEARRSADPGASYVASLLAGPEDGVLKKVVEEAAEAALAAKGGDAAALVREMADLWFHALVVLARWGVPPGAIVAELTRREGVSGLAAKAARAEAGTVEPAPGSTTPPAAGSPTRSGHLP